MQRLEALRHHQRFFTGVAEFFPPIFEKKALPKAPHSCHSSSSTPSIVRMGFVDATDGHLDQIKNGQISSGAEKSLHACFRRALTISERVCHRFLLLPPRAGAHVLREKKYKNICPTWFSLLKGSGRSCPTHPYNVYFFLESPCIFFHVKRVQNRNVLKCTSYVHLLLKVIVFFVGYLCISQLMCVYA